MSKTSWTISIRLSQQSKRHSSQSLPSKLALDCRKAESKDLSSREKPTHCSWAAKLQVLPKSLPLPIRRLSSRNFPPYCGFTSSYNVSRFAGETEICDER